MQSQLVFISAFVCLAICSSLITASALSKSDCPKNFKRIGNKCYWFSRHEEVNWFEANLKCRRMNSFLLTIENSDELVLVSEQLRSLSSPFAWTSINDLSEAGEFYSISSGLPMSYAAWDDQNNQLDNHKGNEHCVHLSYVRLGKYVMNDDDCKNRYAFVCERFYDEYESEWIELNLQ